MILKEESRINATRDIHTCVDYSSGIWIGLSDTVCYLCVRYCSIKSKIWYFVGKLSTTLCENNRQALIHLPDGCSLLANSVQA